MKGKTFISTLMLIAMFTVAMTTLAQNTGHNKRHHRKIITGAGVGGGPHKTLHATKRKGALIGAGAGAGAGSVYHYRRRNRRHH